MCVCVCVMLSNIDLCFWQDMKERRWEESMRGKEGRKHTGGACDMIDSENPWGGPEVISSRPAMSNADHVSGSGSTARLQYSNMAGF